MASIITNSFRILQAKQFRDAFDPTASGSMYIGISKPSQWNNELIPDTPVDSSSFNVSDAREWMAAKRLTSSDTTLAVPRYDWTSGTVYASYDDSDQDLFTKQFYVITDELKLYKCIRKPSPSTPSTVKPTSTVTSGFTTTADGYVWKYLLTVPVADAARFLTDLWVPIRTLSADDLSGSNQWQVQQSATTGTIDYIKINNGGSGYVNPTVTLLGDGNLNGATIVPSVSGGVITSVSITGGNPSGYTWATIQITDTGGTGANIHPILSPILGHGSSAANELGAFFVVVNAFLNYNESGKFPRFNDYRKIFLIQSPTTQGTNTIATGSVYDCTHKLVVSSSTGTFVPDEIVTGQTSGATGIVVEYDDDIKRISITGVNGTFTTGENVLGGTSGVMGNNVTSIVQPELNLLSGSIVYKDYRRYIDRQEGQAENIVIAIEF